MSEEKKCPHCGKKLRRDNTRGACSACLASPGHRPAQAKEPKERDPKEAGELDADAVMTKFRAVTKALNLDADTILAEAAQGWLDGLRGILDGESES